MAEQPSHSPKMKRVAEQGLFQFKLSGMGGRLGRGHAALGVKGPIIEEKLTLPDGGHTPGRNITFIRQAPNGLRIGKNGKRQASARRLEMAASENR